MIEKYTKTVDVKSLRATWEKSKGHIRPCGLRDHAEAALDILASANITELEIDDNGNSANLVTQKFMALVDEKYGQLSLTGLGVKKFPFQYSSPNALSKLVQESDTNALTRTM